jgi:hypothetical protein
MAFLKRYTIQVTSPDGRGRGYLARTTTGYQLVAERRRRARFRSEAAARNVAGLRGSRLVDGNARYDIREENLIPASVMLAGATLGAMLLTAALVALYLAHH